MSREEDQEEEEDKEEEEDEEDEEKDETSSFEQRCVQKEDVSKNCFKLF